MTFLSFAGTDRRALLQPMHNALPGSPGPGTIRDMHILLIEDEHRIADFVSTGLTQRGHTLEHVSNGHRGLERAMSNEFDVVVLDIMLPGRDGLSVLRAMRQDNNHTPVILLTARNELDDRLAGLEQGADDYLAKPFFVEELAARIQALWRRTQGSSQSLLQHGNLILDRISRHLLYHGQQQEQRVELTSREFALLELLMRHAGQLCTRSQILAQVWGYEFDPSTNVVDVCIKRLRHKLTELDTTQNLAAHIEAVRGIGYRFVP